MVILEEFWYEEFLEKTNCTLGFDDGSGMYAKVKHMENLEQFQIVMGKFRPFSFS